MSDEQLIAVQYFCTVHEIDFTFIRSLNEFGLIDVVVKDEIDYLYKKQVNDLEKMIRLHYELDINLEGIDAIIHLLRKTNELDAELKALKNRLKFYEKE